MYGQNGFEWDGAKRVANFQKHGLDFIDAVQLLDGRPALQISARSETEPRLLTVALLNNKVRDADLGLARNAATGYLAQKITR